MCISLSDAVYVFPSVPEEYKVNPGAVECLQQHGLHPDRVLIGYQRGLCVLWDMPSLSALQVTLAAQQFLIRNFAMLYPQFYYCVSTIWL